MDWGFTSGIERFGISVLRCKFYKVRTASIETRLRRHRHAPCSIDGERFEMRKAWATLS